MKQSQVFLHLILKQPSHQTPGMTLYEYLMAKILNDRYNYDYLKLIKRFSTKNKR